MLSIQIQPLISVNTWCPKSNYALFRIELCLIMINQCPVLYPFVCIRPWWKVTLWNCSFAWDTMMWHNHHTSLLGFKHFHWFSVPNIAHTRTAVKSEKDHLRSNKEASVCTVNPCNSWINVRQASTELWPHQLLPTSQPLFWCTLVTPH